jgi:hypothetical protein
VVGVAVGQVVENVPGGAGVQTKSERAEQWTGEASERVEPAAARRRFA